MFDVILNKTYIMLRLSKFTSFADHKTISKLLLFGCLILLLFSCNNSNKHITKTSTNAISNSNSNNNVDDKPIALQITYHIDSIKNDSALNAFKHKYNAVQLRIIAATNRIDVKRIRVKSNLIVPDTLLADFMQYSPFPETLNVTNHVPKFILINKRIQLFAAYDHGKLAQFGPISTGKKSTPTPSGLYYTNFKSKLKTSTVSGEWKMPWYFNISNFEGIGMHQYALPGYPASHSCIRMYEENAKWIYNWAAQWKLSEDGNTILQKGTPVLVFGVYDFDGVAAWKQLAENPKAIDLTKEEIDEINHTIATIDNQNEMISMQE